MLQRKRRRLPAFSLSEDAAPPLSLPSGTPIIYTRSPGETDELCAQLCGARLVGLDIEWRVHYVKHSTQRPAAVLQLCTAGACYVFQLSAMGSFPQRLRELLEDSRVIKAGCKIANDALKLRRDFGIRCAGLVDLGRLAAVALRYGYRQWSLSDLCLTLTGRRLSKDERCTDWEARLTSEQLRYAALDAWASRNVCLALLRRMPPPILREAGASSSNAAAPHPLHPVGKPPPSNCKPLTEAELLLRIPNRSIEDTPADPMDVRRRSVPLPPAGLQVP
jgi:hypothetical protein